LLEAGRANDEAKAVIVYQKQEKKTVTFCSDCGKLRI
jgi:hypothetical protein